VTTEYAALVVARMRELQEPALTGAEMTEAETEAFASAAFEALQVCATARDTLAKLRRGMERQCYGPQSIRNMVAEAHDTLTWALRLIEEGRE
jgi:hypothetical protein